MVIMTVGSVDAGVTDGEGRFADIAGVCVEGVELESLPNYRLFSR